MYNRNTKMNVKIYPEILQYMLYVVAEVNNLEEYNYLHISHGTAGRYGHSTITKGQVSTRALKGTQFYMSYIEVIKFV